MAVTHGDEHEASEDDPFAGLVLDESFVKAAKHAEAPARTREAIARYAHLEQPVLGTGRPSERGPRSKKRRWITVTAVIVLVTLFGYIIWLTGRSSHPAATQAPVMSATPPSSAQSPSASPSGSSSPAPLPGELGSWPPTPATGKCITWQPHEHAPVSVVPCAESHLAEVTGDTDVTSRFAQVWPGRSALDKVTDEICQRPFEVYTGLSVADAEERGVGPSAFYPSESAWKGGSRRVMCTAIKQNYAAFTGSVKGLRKPVTT